MKTRRSLHDQLVALGLSLLAIFQTHAATTVWTNLAGGNWNVAANWEPNQLPATGDSAIITNSGTYTVTLDVSMSLVSLTLGGLSGMQTLVIPSSTLTLQTNGFVAGNGVLTLSGGALSGAGTLTIGGVMNWTAGAMEGGGRTVIEAGGTLNLVNAGAITAYPRMIENGGTVICTGTGDLRCGSAVLTNRSTGTWDLRSNQALGGTGGGFNPRFENAGTFRKSQGTGTNTVFAFVNYPGGRVEVQSGGLQCNAAFDQSGTVTVAAGTALRLASSGTATGLFDTATGGLVDWTGVYTLNPGAQLNGDGLYQVSGATSWWTGRCR